MRKLWSYFHFTGSCNRSSTMTKSSNVPVPVIEPDSGFGTGDRDWYRFQTGD